MSVAITGMGAWSCFGHGIAPIIDALRAARSGRAPIDRWPMDSAWLKDAPAMCAPGFVPGVGRAANPWPWSVEQALRAGRRAFDQAALPTRGARLGVVVGTTHGSSGPLDDLRARAAGDAHPDPDLMVWTAAESGRRLAAAIGARGPVITVSTACSSGLNALGQAARLIEGGEVDAVLAGGHDIASYLTCLGFTSLGAVDPEGTRPLDEARAGLSLGDGAGFMVLERLADARARGAPILGRLTGYATAGEGHHATAPAPDGRGPLQVMAQALARDGRPRELDWVAAHATGTPANDAVELEAIGTMAEAVGADEVDVFALKATLGHTLGAAGALEAVVVLGAMRAGLRPGTFGLQRPIPHSSRLRLPREAAPGRGRLALVNSFGFGGSVSSVCLRPGDGTDETEGAWN